jgi:transposase
MAREIEADYHQILLFPPSLEDWVAADHPARFLREFVDSLDLSKLGFRERPSEEGRPAYSNSLLLKVWLYGYLNRIRSSRGLERACREHLSLIWLTGNHAPDHNTLWRFLKENLGSFKEVFKSCVRVAVEAELVELVMQAVDGTKLAAACSGRTGWHRKELEKRLGEVEEWLEARLKESVAEGGEAGGGYRLPAEVAAGEELRSRIAGALARLGEVARDHLHPGEAEARMMKCGEGYRFGYNAQAVVAAGSGLIVGAEVVNAESDAHLLTGMVGEAAATVGKAAGETVADGGYFSGEELARAEELQYPVVVNLGAEAGEEEAFHSSRFGYEEEANRVICPRGEVLEFERKKASRRGEYEVAVYRCRSFRECPCRGECSSDPRGRMIEISPYHGAVRRQREKQKRPEKADLLKKRMGLIERVFGQIKEALGFRRFALRGLAGAGAQWSLICTTYNLQRLYPAWREGFLVLV